MAQNKQQGRPAQPVRGTHDILGEDYRKHAYVMDTALATAACYEYEPIATPIFEYTHIFQRSLGETSDIVGKEMYTFEDRGGDSITLRPEGTAPVARAVISNGLTQSLPLKFIYTGPMLRYERPQKGRLRQFHQVGVECLGVADPASDVETIALGAHILQKLGILEHTTLEINTLGDRESRTAYRQALVDHFSQHKDKLSADSQERLERNPLRILDSKSEQDKALIESAPVFSDYLTEDSVAYYEAVLKGLDNLGIKYQKNPRLVRGLDYYNHTAFEFTTTELGAQGTVLAGGRYNGLVAELGGPDIPGIGWACGIERLALMLQTLPEAPRPVALIPLGDEAIDVAQKLAAELRSADMQIHLAFSGNMGKRMKRADKARAKIAVILGEDELKARQATVRDLDSGAQESVDLSSLQSYLKDKS